MHCNNPEYCPDTNKFYPCMQCACCTDNTELNFEDELGLFKSYPAVVEDDLPF